MTRPRNFMDPKKSIREPEIRKLLKYALSIEDYEMYMLIRLASTLGLRPTEAVHFRVEDLSRIDEQIVIVRAAKKGMDGIKRKWRRKRKRLSRYEELQGAINRPPYMHQVSLQLCKELTKYLDMTGVDPKSDEGWLFPGKTPGRPIHVRSFHRWLAELCEDVGIPHKTPHAFRHYLGFRIQRERGDIVLTSKQLRHSKASTAELYVNMTPSEDRQFATKIDDVGELGFLEDDDV